MFLSRCNSKASNVSAPSMSATNDSDSIILHHQTSLISMTSNNSSIMRSPKVDIMANRRLHSPTVVKPPPMQLRPTSSECFSTSGNLFLGPSRRPSEISTQLFDPLPPMAVASYPTFSQPSSICVLPIFPTTRTNLSHLRRYSESQDFDPFDALPQPFKDHLPALMRQPIPYVNKKLGGWNIPHYPRHPAPPIDFTAIEPQLKEIGYSVHPSIVYYLKYQDSLFRGWRFSIGQEVVLGVTRSPIVGYFLMRLVSMHCDGQYGRVLALCVRKDGSGIYYDCDSACPPVEILIPLVNLEQSLLDTYNHHTTKSDPYLKSSSTNILIRSWYHLRRYIPIC